MTKKDDVFQFKRIELTWLLFAAAVVFVYLFGLDIPLLGPDEPRYAQVAREMYERSDWVTPTLGGHTWFEKPALLYWLQIASYNLFGVSEFSARFGSALFGLGTIFSLWLLGRNVATEDGTGRSLANWLALIGASTLGIIVFSRGASFDIILTFPITAAMVSFFIYDHRSRNGSGGQFVPLALFYTFIGVSLLAKGLIGIVFPFAIAAFYYLLGRRFPARTFIISLFWGTLVAAVVAAAWYLPMYIRHGWHFIDEFFIQHHFQRYTSNKYFHPQPFYFFFWVLPLMTIPWLPFFFAGVWDLIRSLFPTRAAVDTQNDSEEGRGGREASRSLDELALFAAAWIAVPLVFFSFSGSKLPGYILPAVPAASIIAGIYLFRMIGRKPQTGRWVQLTAAATFVIVVLSLVFAVPRFAEIDSVKSLIAAADREGFAGVKVVTLHNVSHNAEFYAAGRLLRDAQGKQVKLLGPAEVAKAAAEANGPVLVLVPIEYIEQATDGRFLKSNVIKDNGELAIVAVTAL